MNDFAMDNGEVYGAAVPAYEFKEDNDSGYGLVNTDTITFTVSGSSGASSDDYIFITDGTDTNFTFDGSTTMFFGDPIEDMKDVVSKMSEEFLEKYR